MQRSLRFLANTGLLFQGMAIGPKLHAAALAGFDGVEFHDEVQRADAGALAEILSSTGLRVGSLNTCMQTSIGCAALPDEQARFIRDIRAAHDAAQTIGARAVHVLAGRGDWNPTVYAANLRRALDLTDKKLLIEPISHRALPGYALSRLPDALEICAQIDHPRLRVMFDWFHMADTLGPEQARQALQTHRQWIGHVQLAAAGTRTEPDAALVQMVIDAGFGWVGLEYRPTRPEMHVLAELRVSASPDHARHTL
jgi:hydroxypyruvate isomerase